MQICTGDVILTAWVTLCIMYTFEVCLAHPMFNFATPMLIVQPQYLFSFWVSQTELETRNLVGRVGKSWNCVGNYLLVLVKMEQLGPAGSADSPPTPAIIRVGYSTELRFASPMSFPKFRPCILSLIHHHSKRFEAI